MSRTADPVPYEAGSVFIYIDKSALARNLNERQKLVPTINVRPMEEDGQGAGRRFKAFDLEILDDAGNVVARIVNRVKKEDMLPGSPASVFIEADHVRTIGPADFGPWQTAKP